MNPGEREQHVLEALEDFARRGPWMAHLARMKTYQYLPGGPARIGGGDDGGGVRDGVRDRRAAGVPTGGVRGGEGSGS